MSLFLNVFYVLFYVLSGNSIAANVFCIFNPTINKHNKTFVIVIVTEFGADGEDVFLIEIIPYTKTNGPNGKAREDIPYTVTNTNDLNELMDWDAQHFPEHLSGTGFYILVFYVNAAM